MEGCTQPKTETAKALCAAQEKIADLEDTVANLKISSELIDCTLISSPREAALCAAGKRSVDLENSVAGLEKADAKYSESTIAQIIENIPTFVTTALGVIAVAAGLLALVILWRVVDSKKLAAEKATISIGGSSVTLTKTEEKINQLLSDVQSHIIDQTAQQKVRMQRLANATQGDGMKAAVETTVNPLEHFGLPEPDHPKLDGLRILWAHDNPDTLKFETTVLTKMGNEIEVVDSNADAIGRLRFLDKYDLVLSDMDRTSDGSESGLILYKNLSKGITSQSWLSEPRLTKIGVDL